MATAVFLKGINVGGHRSFRPTALASHLARLGTTNVGAAGTFLIRERVSHQELRVEIQRWVPFEVSVLICPGRALLALTTSDPFRGRRQARTQVRFVAIRDRSTGIGPRPPFALPPTGRWSVQVLAQRGRFLVGLHRREMTVLRHLRHLEQLVGGTITFRSWDTILTLARLLAS